MRRRTWGAGCVKVETRFDQSEVEPFYGGVDGQHHERQIGVDEPDQDGEIRVYHLQWMLDYAGCEQQTVDQPVIAQQQQHGVSADQQIGPERDGDQEGQHVAPSRTARGDVIGGGKSQQQRGEGGKSRLQGRSPENRQIGGVERERLVEKVAGEEKLDVVLEIEGPFDAAVIARPQERIDQDDRHWGDADDAHHGHCRAEQKPPCRRGAPVDAVLSSRRLADRDDFNFGGHQAN